MMKLGLPIVLFFLTFAPSFAVADPHSLYLSAYEKFLQANLNAAESDIRDSLKLDASIAESHHLLARILLRQNRNEEANNSFRMAQHIRRTNRETIELMRSSRPAQMLTGVEGVGFLATYATDEAKKAYYLGKVALRQGRWQEAAEFFFKARNLDASKPEYINALGNVYLDLGDMIAAEDIFQESLKTNPLQRDVYVSMIEKFGEQAKPFQALQWSRKAQQVFPSDRYFQDRELYFEHQNRRRLFSEGKDPYLRDDL
ncbi:MAG: hypothetical protein H3C47_00865 [Candidatus Cloacimonetes bacterium]|nr:hypothetical protein [Candidatus Cloacimonadota bacterium]